MTNPSSSVSRQMVAAGEITTDTDLIAALLSESLSELSAAVSQEKVNKEISPETFRRHRCSEPGSALSRYVWSFVFQLLFVANLAEHFPVFSTIILSLFNLPNYHGEKYV